jgi:Family of unknown function (DUF5808)
VITRSDDQSTTRHKKKPVSRFIGMVALAMLISALGRELSKPAAERTWHGKLWQFVPYDFRPPTWARIRERMWSPDRPGLLSPHVFGVGWTVNLGRAYALVRSIAQGNAARPTSSR